MAKAPVKPPAAPAKPADGSAATQDNMPLPPEVPPAPPPVEPEPPSFITGLASPVTVPAPGSGGITVNGEISSVNPVAEIGVTGLKQATGFLWEEYLPQLRGRQGMRIYQEMTDNDPTCGAILKSLTTTIKRTNWDVTPSIERDPEALAAKVFVEGILEDMSHTWQDFISEALTCLSYGFSYFEIVYKQRMGPTQDDPSRRSKFDDGLIGIRKLAPRSQDSLLRWEIEPDGGILGFHQLPPIGGGQYFIPISRALLIRTVSRKNNPEGVSVLRNAYRPWYFVKNIEEYEAIGIERDLAGLPIARIPSKYLASKNPTDMAVVAGYQSIVRDMKMNQQAGIVIPSDMWPDKDGSPTANPLVTIELLKSAGSAKNIETDKIVQRHMRAMARSVLADFLMLGEGSTSAKAGSSMHNGKLDFFLESCQALLDQISDPINRYMIPRLWAINGLPEELMPTVKPSKLSQMDLTALGQFLDDMATAGILTPDGTLEDFARDAAGVPPRQTEDTL